MLAIIRYPIHAEVLELGFADGLACCDPRHAGDGRGVVTEVIALLENGQQEDGSVILPEALTTFGAPSVLPPAA
ncbi:unannotated protein [freshwater metagenome]|uniref:Unannotated protein n=1 Tax=freshwater metagenome TaxID=449393 RepID=A0A6J7DA44_9ZZZZ